MGLPAARTLTGPVEGPPPAWAAPPRPAAGARVDVDARVSREAQLVGLRGETAPTLDAIERRRLQLAGVTVFLLLAVSIGVWIVPLWVPSASGVLSPSVVRVGLVLISLGFGAYAIEKELHLRRLGRMLVDERVVSTSLANRVATMGLLLEAGKAMNSELKLDAVLDTIVRSAMDLVGGASGEIMVLEAADGLVTVLASPERQAVGERVRIGAGVAGRVAATREPALVGAEDPGGSDEAGEPASGRRTSMLSVPLVSRGVLFGVLNVHAGPGHRFGPHDLQAASLLAEQAAGALANARRYEIEQLHPEGAPLLRELGTL